MYEGRHLRLIRDIEVSRLTSMSRSWVRKKRMNRRRGWPHVRPLIPVYVGPVPLYIASDVEAWLASQCTQAKWR